MLWLYRKFFWAMEFNEKMLLRFTDHQFEIICFEVRVLRIVFVSYFFVIVTVIVRVIVPYAMFILLL